MTFQKEMQRRLFNNREKEAQKNRLILSKEEDIAKFIAEKIMTVIKRYNYLTCHNDVYVKIKKAKDSCLKIRLWISFVPGDKKHNEFFIIQTDRDELNYDDRSNIYFFGKILELLEVMLKKEGFTNLLYSKYTRDLHASLNLI